jgi:hypothetical protein
MAAAAADGGGSRWQRVVAVIVRWHWQRQCRAGVEDNRDGGGLQWTVVQWWR